MPINLQEWKISELKMEKFIFSGLQSLAIATMECDALDEKIFIGRCINLNKIGIKLRALFELKIIHKFIKIRRLNKTNNKFKNRPISNKYSTRKFNF